MLIKESPNTMTITSIEQIKLFMGILFIIIGLLIAINVTFHGITAKNLVGVFILIPSIWLLVDVRHTSVNLSRQGVSTATYRTLHSSETIEFSTQNIKSVRKVEYLGIGNGSTGPNDILELIITDEPNLQLAATRQNKASARLFRPYRKSGQRIANFLGVPFEIKKTDLLKEAMTGFKEK